MKMVDWSARVTAVEDVIRDVEVVHPLARKNNAYSRHEYVADRS